MVYSLGIIDALYALILRFGLGMCSVYPFRHFRRQILESAARRQSMSMLATGYWQLCNYLLPSSLKVYVAPR